jgi:hypothetical protein
MGRSFKNYTLSIASVLLLICFVACLIGLLRVDFNLSRRIAVIALAILSFFTALNLLMQIKSRKNKDKK